MAPLAASLLGTFGEKEKQSEDMQQRKEGKAHVCSTNSARWVLFLGFYLFSNIEDFTGGLRRPICTQYSDFQGCPFMCSCNKTSTQNDQGPSLVISPSEKSPEKGWDCGGSSPAWSAMCKPFTLKYPWLGKIRSSDLLPGCKALLLLCYQTHFSHSTTKEFPYLFY